MISHKYKCIFIHIPKTGGTSVESALGHLDGHDGRGGQDHRSLRTLQNPIWNFDLFSSADNLIEVARRIKYRFRNSPNPKNRFVVSKKQYSEYFKFSVIRNPWARAYSHYKGVMRDEMNKKYLKITTELEFEEFLSIFMRKGLIRPQTYWLKDYNGAIPLDFICRFETLQTDFTTVCQRLRLESVELPHKIKGSGEDYGEKYDNATIKLVADAYAEEIALFDYAFAE